MGADLCVFVGVCEAQGQNEGAASGGVVAGIVRDARVVAGNSVGVPVERDGVAVGEDEDVAVGEEEAEWVEVVGAGAVEKGERVGAVVVATLGVEFVAVFAAAADDYLASAGREQDVGGVPAADSEGLVEFVPVAVVVGAARRERANLPVAFEVAARLHEDAGVEELAARAPCVGLDEQGAHRAVPGVEHHGVRPAIILQDALQRLVPAPTTRELDLRRPSVGPVQHDQRVEVRHGRVHCRNPCVIVDHLPCPLRICTRPSL